MEYRVLGPLEVHDGQGSLPLAGAKQRALLALLLVHANHVLSRDRLIDELWGDEPPETAVQSLQVYVSRLRKLLPAETLLTRPPGYLLAIEPAELDLHRFERLLGEGREALAEGDPGARGDCLHEALGLWRGPALAEFAFEPFAQAEIGRLEELRLAAVEERIEADLALGRHADLVGELEALDRREPVPGAAARPAHARALPLGPTGRGARGLSERTPRPRRRARHRAERRAAKPGEVDPHPGRRPRHPRVQDGPSGRAPPPLERKLVTVLFADLGMANELEEDPERTETFLAEVHREAEAEIEAAGGTVERGIAGALIATFGAPHAREEDHALRAVSAALATRKRLGAVFGETLWLRLSVESGEVILGRPGSFVTGMPVGAAARLIRSSAPGEIVVGERAAATTCGAFELSRAGRRVRARRDAHADTVAGAERPSAQAKPTFWRWLPARSSSSPRSRPRPSSRPTPVTRRYSCPPIRWASSIPRRTRWSGTYPSGGGPTVSRSARTPSGSRTWTTRRCRASIRSRAPSQARSRFDATPTGLAVGFGSVWVAHGLVGTVSRVAPQYAGVETIRLPLQRADGSAGARGSITVGDGSVWAAFGDSSVFRIDPMSGDVIATMQAGNTPSAIAFGSRSIWVTNERDSSVTRINPTTNGTSGRDINVGLKPAGITVAGGAVWVTDTGNDRVTRIDPGQTRFQASPSETPDRHRLRRGLPLGRKQRRRNGVADRSDHERGRHDDSRREQPAQNRIRRRQDLGDGPGEGCHLRQSPARSTPCGSRRHARSRLGSTRGRGCFD